MGVFWLSLFQPPLCWVLAGVGAFLGAAALVWRRIASEMLLSEDLPTVHREALYTAAQLELLREMIAGTGYDYDWRQDIFYSVRNPWQRKFGYCSLYDASAAALGMVFDCEPVRFEHGGKRWLIELWKGQYGITVGGEIGVYNTSGPDLDIPGVFSGTFYQCASDEECLSMTYTLLKKGKAMFSRADRHWWLTGFKLGDFAKPSSLTMEASITFGDMQMKEAFLQALYNLGYSESEVRHSGATVLVVFSRPRSRQPLARRGLVAAIALWSNRRMVLRYRRLVRGVDNVVDALAVLKEKSPVLYGLALNLGRRGELFRRHEAILDHVGWRR